MVPKISRSVPAPFCRVATMAGKAEIAGKAGISYLVEEIGPNGWNLIIVLLFL